MPVERTRPVEEAFIGTAAHTIENARCTLLRSVARCGSLGSEGERRLDESNAGVLVVSSDAISVELITQQVVDRAHVRSGEEARNNAPRCTGAFGTSECTQLG
jgi:hypothetical protein